MSRQNKSKNILFVFVKEGFFIEELGDKATDFDAYSLATVEWDKASDLRYKIVSRPTDQLYPDADLIISGHGSNEGIGNKTFNFYLDEFALGLLVFNRYWMQGWHGQSILLNACGEKPLRQGFSLKFARICSTALAEEIKNNKLTDAKVIKRVYEGITVYGASRSLPAGRGLSKTDELFDSNYTISTRTY